MASLLQLLPNAVNQGQAKVIYAEVVAPEPITFADPLTVVIPDWDPTLPFSIPGPDWPELHGATLPIVGTPLTLLVDSRGVERCVWWSGPHS